MPRSRTLATLAIMAVAASVLSFAPAAAADETAGNNADGVFADDVVTTSEYSDAVVETAAVTCVAQGPFRSCSDTRAADPTVARTVSGLMLGMTATSMLCEGTTRAVSTTQSAAPTSYSTERLTTGECRRADAITIGYGDPGNYTPNSSLTRAEAVTLLWRATGFPSPGPRRFTDVPLGSWYDTAAHWAYARGITTGVDGGTTFAPHRPINRAELIAMIWRFRGSPNQLTPQQFIRENPFTDVAYPNYFSSAAVWGVTSGIVSSRSTFNPATVATRAEAITFIWRMYGSPAPATNAWPGFSDVPVGAYYFQATRWAGTPVYRFESTERLVGTTQKTATGAGTMFMRSRTQNPACSSSEYRLNPNPAGINAVPVAC